MKRRAGLIKEGETGVSMGNITGMGQVTGREISKQSMNYKVRGKDCELNTVSNNNAELYIKRSCHSCAPT